MNSHLLVGKVAHRRSSPADYALEHDVWYIALDLDELPAVGRRLRLFRRNRRAPLSFRDTDYLPEPSADLRAAIRRHLRATGVALDGGRVTLVTTPRVLGYQFNPASFYLCHDANGALSAVVVEVHNTFGERHLYTLAAPARPGSSSFSAEMDKEFYVSPFLGDRGHYRVTVRENDGRLTIGINEREDDVPMLATSLNLRRVALTDRNLAYLMLRHPLVTHKTIAAIHWHAFRLWLRRVPWHRHVAAPQAAPPAAIHGAGIAAHGARR